MTLPPEALAPAGEGRAVRLEERLGEPPPEATRDRPGHVPQERRCRGGEILVAADLRTLGEVAGELPFEGAPDPRAVVAEGPDGPLDRLGQEGRREIGPRSADEAPQPAQEPLRPPEDEEGEAGRKAEGPDRIVTDPGRQVEGGPDRRLGPAELLGEGLPGGYDFRPSGRCSRSHSIVSFVVSIVSVGQ